VDILSKKRQVRLHGTLSSAVALLSLFPPLLRLLLYECTSRLLISFHFPHTKNDTTKIRTYLSTSPCPTLYPIPSSLQKTASRVSSSNPPAPPSAVVSVIAPPPTELTSVRVLAGAAESFPSPPSSLPCALPSPPAVNVAPVLVFAVVDAVVEVVDVAGGWSWKI
jgi:hypothetical protein